jgi:hypothetical protein
VTITPFIALHQLRSDTHKALRAWHITGGTINNLLGYLFLVQEQRSAMVQDGSPTTLRFATNQVLLDCIKELEVQDQTGARVLQSRFIKNNKLMAVANQLNVSEHSVSRLQKAAIKQLANIIYGCEQAIREKHAQFIESQLPPSSYTCLFGLDDICAELEALLLPTEAPWVIALVGIGGSGKTALADAVTRQIIRYFCFDQIIWVRTESQTISGRSRSPQLTYEDFIITLAKQLRPDSPEHRSFDQRIFQVRQALKQRPYLIVIDNLESEIDTAYLLNHLNDLSNPSKFLLTSRTRLSEQATILNFSVDELTLDDAESLLRHHAHDVGVKAMSTATKSDIQAIYNAAGGNPLALKLVVSLLDLLPLSQVLTNLSRSQTGAIEKLYRHIYWQTWKLLSTNARKLLLAMPLVAEYGGRPKYLHTISGLPESELWPALQELRSRSLLEVRGTLQEKRYGIHRLTKTFLHTDIIHWAEDELDSE